MKEVANHSQFRLGRLVAWVPSIREKLVARATRQDRTSGRVFSFLVQKP
jgi:hypothetical protein